MSKGWGTTFALVTALAAGGCAPRTEVLGSYTETGSAAQFVVSQVETLACGDGWQVAPLTVDPANGSSIDLALASGECLNLLRGNGDGSFAAAQQATCSGTPGEFGSALAVGQLDGAGPSDIVAVRQTDNSEDESVNVCVGDGSGAFARAPDNGIHGLGRPGAVKIAETTGDGVNEFLVITHEHEIKWHVDDLVDASQEQFYFFWYDSNYDTQGVAFADVDGSGYPDIVAAIEPTLVGGGAGGEARVWLNSDLVAEGQPWGSPEDPNPRFGSEPAVEVPSSSVPMRSIAAGDLVNDAQSCADLIVHDGMPAEPQPSVAINTGPGSTLLVLRNDCGGGQPDIEQVESVSVDGIVWAELMDVDSDGTLDVVALLAPTKRLAVLLGDGTGALASPVMFDLPGTPNTLAAADFDGDGDDDLAVSLLGGDDLGAVVVLTNNWKLGDD